MMDKHLKKVLQENEDLIIESINFEAVIECMLETEILSLADQEELEVSSFFFLSTFSFSWIFTNLVQLETTDLLILILAGKFMIFDNHITHLDVFCI